MTAPDLQATLDAIETLAVHQCGHCSRPLSEDGQSLDFCDDYCQQAWISNRNEIVELVGYREPYDLPEHQVNQVELYSPEVTPAWEGWPTCSCGACRGETATTNTATFTLTYDVSRFREAISGMWERLYANYFEQIVELGTWQPTGLIQGISPLRSVLVDETRWYSLVEPTPEPASVTPDGPFDPDYEYDWRPVPGLHDSEPPLPVMAPAERDWQALIDAGTPRFQAPQRAPRQINARRSR